MAYIIGWALAAVGPRGPAFAKYSIAYHYARNTLHVLRTWPAQAAARHVPVHARKIVQGIFSSSEIERLVEAGRERVAGGVGGVQEVPYQIWNASAAAGASLVRSQFASPPLSGALARWVAALLGLPPSKL